jgi:hypothetical protein
MSRSRPNQKFQSGSDRTKMRWFVWPDWTRSKFKRSTMNFRECTTGWPGKKRMRFLTNAQNRCGKYNMWQKDAILDKIFLISIGLILFVTLRTFLVTVWMPCKVRNGLDPLWNGLNFLIDSLDELRLRDSHLASKPGSLDVPRVHSVTWYINEAR